MQFPNIQPTLWPLKLFRACSSHLLKVAVLRVPFNILLSCQAISRAFNFRLMMATGFRIQILQCDSFAGLPVAKEVSPWAEYLLHSDHVLEGIREDAAHLVPVSLAPFGATDTVVIVEPKVIHRGQFDTGTFNHGQAIRLAKFT